jgi:hypothetical protein
MYFGFIEISHGVLENFKSGGSIISIASEHTNLKTALKCLMTVSPKC